MSETAEQHRLAPLTWVGGKYAAAERILAAFPPAHTYGTYVEVFGGAAHILLRKDPGRHIEVYNDLNGDLVHFWMTARDYPQELQQRIDSLPYSRQLFYTYRESLRAQEPVYDVERAVRWFYVMRSVFGGHPNGDKGWGYVVGSGDSHSSQAKKLYSAAALFGLVAKRFRSVQIEHQDYAKIIQVYQTPKTLFYVDPPYIGHEEPYVTDEVPLFTIDNHQKLAALLNATPALVALSYYEHPLLKELYPSPKWRRMAWMQSKAIHKTREKRQQAHEVLLMNYPETLGSIWEDQKEQEGTLCE